MKKPVKCITLFSGDNPMEILVPGHLGQGDFNAIVNQSWDGGLAYRFKEMTYGFRRRNKRGQYAIVPAGTRGSKPYTWVRWDHL